MTNTLVRLVRRMGTESAIHAVLDEALVDEPNTELVRLDFSRGDAAIDVLSTVLAPAEVRRVDEASERSLGERLHLGVLSR